MTNSIANAMTDAAGFHADSNTDAHEIDHCTVQQTERVYNPQNGNKLSETIEVKRSSGEGEEKDFAAAAEQQDKEGTAPSENGKLHTGTGSKSPTPFWVLRDFAWVPGTNKSTGETFWNLRPLADRVNLIASYAPGLLVDAALALSDADKELARNLGEHLSDLNAVAATADTWLENTATYAYLKDAGKNACSAVVWTEAQQEAHARKAEKSAAEHAMRALDSGRKAAILKLALFEAAPTKEINFKSAAWDLFNGKAYAHAKNFMNPDEEKAVRDAEAQATATMGFKLRAAS